jgi:hypothetical protein
MKARKPFWHALMQVGGPARGAHRQTLAGAVRSRMTRGILALGLAVGGISAEVIAVQGHGPAATHATSHHAAGTNAKPIGSGTSGDGTTAKRPWMY